MKKGVVIGSDVSKHGSISEGHREGVGGMRTQEMFESFLRQLRVVVGGGGRAAQLLRRMSKRLVKYSQHFSYSNKLYYIIYMISHIHAFDASFIYMLEVGEDVYCLQFGWTRGLMMLDKDYFLVFQCLYPLSDFSFILSSIILAYHFTLLVVFYFLGHGINL